MISNKERKKERNTITCSICTQHKLKILYNNNNDDDGDDEDEDEDNK